MVVREEILIGSKADTRGFKVAESAAQKLGKTVKGLAGTLGLAFGTAAVINFGKQSAAAFIEDQKAATKLANAVKNLGLEFSNPAIAQYIEKLSLQAGVADDELRPAFQALIQQTGSLTQSQKLLSQAIDVSRGSGVDLATVSNDLAQAYVGNTKGLKKYYLGLTAAELKTASFATIQEKLNKQYSGANAAYLETYAGKVEALGIAAGEAKEKIGGAIIDAGMLISGSSGIDELITKMNTLADTTVGWIDRFSEGLALIRAIKDSNMGNITKNIQDVQVAAYNARLRRDYMKAWEGVNVPKSPKELAAIKKAEDDARKRAKALVDAQNKATAELKKQAALKKAGSVFDKEQINLIAALKGKISEDDKLRAEAQLAILNQNDVLASSLTKQILMAQDGTGKLYQWFLAIGDTKIKNPFEFLDDWLKNFKKQLDETFTTSNYTPATISPAIAALGVTAGYGDYSGSVTGQYSNQIENGLYGMQTPLLPSDLAVSYSPQTGLSYNANDINLTITGEGDLTNAIANALQNQSLSSGNQAYINRRTGGFE